ATHREGDEHLLGGLTHDVIRRLPVTRRRCDVEEREFVRALGVIEPGEFDGITRVPQIGEIDPFDHTPRVDVETGNDSHRDGHALSLTGRTAPTHYSH